MEYVADELGVEVLRVPALQRELSVRADPARHHRAGGSSARRPDVLHTHTAKAGATGRVAASPPDGRGRRPSFLHLPRPCPERLLRRAAAEVDLTLVERCSAPTSGNVDRRERRGARRPRRLRRRTGRRFVVVPYGFDLPPWSSRGARRRRGATRHASRARRGRVTFVVGWAGRLTAIKRPLDLVRTLRALLDQGVDALLVLVGDGEDRPTGGARGGTRRDSSECRLSASSRASVRGTRRSTRRC